ncbi:MAG TPA: FAD-dependent oxidoreductase, partial [Thermoanaerobaculia bacterium]|nr:FAD-dependent oxidoreductase [Thermoanaerobaculia bacterium]
MREPLVIVKVDDLPDGGRIAGKIGDEEVVLARSGDEYFAVSAHCTHYHGPLAEGLVVGDTIRCPWHHACFSLRTGSAIAAPAHRALRVFTVTREGDLLRVTADPPPIPAEPAPRGPQRIVIIGGGAAGAFAAFELRRIGYMGSVTLLTRESRVPYDKPNLSKDYLAGRAPAEWIPLRTEADYAADDITLRLGAEVASIDTAAHEVYLADGERLPYDRLILATGASPRRLDVGGDGIRYLRTWNDAEDLLAATKDARRAVVIGASFIGLETAASLRERGLEVTVVGVEERPLEKVLGRELAAFVQRTHESHGIRFRLGRHPVEVRGDAVLLDDGSSEACDVVIAGIGVMPD